MPEEQTLEARKAPSVSWCSPLAVWDMCPIPEEAATVEFWRNLMRGYDCAERKAGALRSPERRGNRRIAIPHDID